ncbi:MAG: NAD-dependent protein deacylase [Anaerotignum propionicum]|uniref:NAD-dependent protein deacylase n=1 Tax=Anaerotignum propionicum TaxID=28446 RepID=UPI002B21B516|nr:NAD-dependent protein deacylase [Anaerotignum propionicum]MEA5056267.1 NAD-dependent protein deacylase [Anaerotignum propionicum]
MEDNIALLKKWIQESDNIVFFGGAGVSTESGLPDFRSENGIFSAMSEYGYRPETILSHSFFERNPEVFFRYYKKTLLYPDAKPNDCHKALAKLEADGKLRAVITQNIDDLHQKAGSKKVFELHGTLYRNYCVKCGQEFPLEYVTKEEGITRCNLCGGVVRPDVVLYEESLNEETIEKSVSFIANADVLIIGGTSLNVYPAAGLIRYYDGKRMVLINKSETPYDDKASLIITKSIGEVFREIVEF